MIKPIAYIDMDHTACDFEMQSEKFQKMYPKVAWPQSISGFFSGMNPLWGFMNFWNNFNDKLDIRLATRPSYYNLHSYTEKAIWVRDHLGPENLNKLYLVPDKSVLRGDYLIDDGIMDGQPDFKGKFIHLYGEEFSSWTEIYTYFYDMFYPGN